MMNTDYIKELLNAFYNGETSVEEEHILRDYFKGDDIDPELVDEKEFFVALYQPDRLEVPLNMESKLELLIDNLSKKEEKLIESEPHLEPHLGKQKKQLVFWVSGIAAAILVLIAVSQSFNKGQSSNNNPLVNVNPELKDTYTDPETAYKEAQKALSLLASNFNKGIDQAEVASANMNKATELLNKGLNRKNKKQS